VSAPMREWVTFQDPKNKHRLWEIDVTFLTSRWQCIFGCGCQGVLTEPAPELAQGCCSYGAHFTNKKDRDLVVRAAKRLTADQWQFRDQGRKKGIFAKLSKKEWRTRLVKDACIFLNRPGFERGPGCALHVLAMDTGEHHSALKPEVCWQLPLRVIDRDDEDDEDLVISQLTEFARVGWGEGGEEFAWWCTEDPAAFTAAEPVYKTMGEELRKTLGENLYRDVVAYLDDRANGAQSPIAHPTEVPVTLTRRR
jgi:hypothetical protein